MTRILLLEPDRKLAEVYRSFLESKGQEVVVAHHAQDAVMAADACRPDVVVLELQLVGHSGVEFLHEFRSYAEWWSVPIIVHTMVSPLSFGGDEMTLRRFGIVQYLYKPASTLQHLSDAINEYVPLTA